MAIGRSVNDKFIYDKSPMMTVAEVAELIHISPSTLRRWTDRGLIQTHCISTRGDRRFKREDIIHFLANMERYKNGAKETDDVE